MKNREKYEHEIIDIARCGEFCEFIEEQVLPSNDLSCDQINCSACSALVAIWLEEEYIEPEVDWSKVAVDTPIFVKNSECAKWEKRYFAKYENGKVYTYDFGCTSWSNPYDISFWEYAKLAELEKETK